MTKTEAAKIERTLSNKSSYKINSNTEIIKYDGYYSTQYSLRCYDGSYWQTVTVSYKLSDILELL